MSGKETKHFVGSNIPDFPDFRDDGSCTADGTSYHVYWAGTRKLDGMVFFGMDTWARDEASVKTFICFLEENFKVHYASVVRHETMYIKRLSL
jgi:hypothetical protein